MPGLSLLSLAMVAAIFVQDLSRLPSRTGLLFLTWSRSAMLMYASATSLHVAVLERRGERVEATVTRFGAVTRCYPHMIGRQARAITPWRILREPAFPANPRVEPKTADPLDRHCRAPVLRRTRCGHGRRSPGTRRTRTVRDRPARCRDRTASPLRPGTRTVPGAGSARFLETFSAGATEPVRADFPPMIDFANGTVFKLHPAPPQELGPLVAPLLIPQEQVVAC
ncbi:hypothetical protein Ais01nite_21970 [Asanoa ishikariensis]|nr:hypothetical protein Ais01nite_21970 [Asanoa ishikariensis]